MIPHLCSSFAFWEVKDDVPGIEDTRCPAKEGKDDADEKVMVATGSLEDG